MLPTLNGTARLIDDPELRYAASGGAVVKVRLAFNSRKKDPSGEWKDDASFFITGTAFGQAAENIAATLQRGMEVVVSGRMKTDSWEKDGEKKSAPSLLVDSIGPSLRFATARVEKVGGSGSGRQEFQQARQQQGSGDPWGSGAPAGGGGWGGGAVGGDEPPF
ncbi:single-stranded DNA-binding protein [Streptomyces hygroscopicus]|uniref:single-stranded DNA-binding protein n=1 Tax=Streptomyces hygroscopicus TaxID=1912 RepID=UPI0033C54D5D